MQVNGYLQIILNYYRNLNLESPTAMHVGGDITYRNLTYSVGGKWADEKGNEKDVLSILQDNAFNLARIRIYNKPAHR